MLGGIRIGELDRSVVFENVNYTSNAIGNTRQELYTDAFTVKGKFLTNRGQEVFQSEQQIGQLKAEVLIRYTKLVSQTMRFKDLYHGIYYYVSSIQQNPREGYCIINGESRDNRV